MPIFDVIHVIGEQGFGETTEDLGTVEARTPMEAIRKVATCLGWNQHEPNAEVASLMNPEAPNRDGEYCDYYMAELRR
ncbi:MAG: hypothetical protein GY792_21955 [Gammaproteobacteria bacterium]|nr:hypothetical protein [Gammaproteobacteria bacterium]